MTREQPDARRRELYSAAFKAFEVVEEWSCLNPSTISTRKGADPALRSIAIQDPRSVVNGPTRTIRLSSRHMNSY